MADQNNNQPLEEQVRTELCQALLSALRQRPTVNASGAKALAEAYAAMFGQYQPPEEPNQAFSVAVGGQR